MAFNLDSATGISNSFKKILGENVFSMDLDVERSVLFIQIAIGTRSVVHRKIISTLEESRQLSGIHYSTKYTNSHQSHHPYYY